MAQLLAGMGPGTAEAHRLELVQVVPEHLFRVPIGSGHQQPCFLRREKTCDGSRWLPPCTGTLRPGPGTKAHEETRVQGTAFGVSQGTGELGGRESPAFTSTPRTPCARGRQLLKTRTPFHPPHPKLPTCQCARPPELPEGGDTGRLLRLQRSQALALSPEASICYP